MKMKSQLKSPWILIVAMGLFCLITLSMQNPNSEKTQITIKSGQTGLMTQIIQNAIDSCAAKGGGVVIFPSGIYRTGGIELKSNVTLRLEKGTLIQGSDKYADYKNDALIYGKDLSNIAIQGEGTIDGVNCRNSDGEEGFRGPHCIRFVNCKHISLKDFTIKNSANWGLNMRYCSFGNVERVKIRAGHDGLHTRFCDNFTVSGCDFRTGDDAFAGNDNQNFSITDCRINSACNGIRMGCKNLRVERCEFWGPAQYIHKISKRKNMLCAFAHFSPDDENSKIVSGNWIIKDVTIDNVDFVYMYNFNNGLWQTGQPVSTVSFENVRAKVIGTAFYINGGNNKDFQLNIKNSSFSHRGGKYIEPPVFEDAKLGSAKFFDATNFKSIKFDHVTFDVASPDVVVNASNGELVHFKNLKITPDSTSNSFNYFNIKQIK